MLMVHEEDYKGYRIEIEYDEDPPNPRQEMDPLGSLCFFSGSRAEHLSDKGEMHTNIDYWLSVYGDVELNENDVENDLQEKQDRIRESMLSWKKVIPFYMQGGEEVKWVGTEEDIAKYEQLEYVQTIDVIGEQTRRRERAVRNLDKKLIYLAVNHADHGSRGCRISEDTCPEWSEDIADPHGVIYIELERVRKEYGWKRITKKRRSQVLGYLRGELQTFDDWANGNAYNYNIRDLDSDGEPGEDLDSCCGFYGDYDDGALEAAKEVIDSWKKKENSESLCSTGSVRTTEENLLSATGMVT